MTDQQDVPPTKRAYSDASGDEAKLMPIAVHALHLLFFVTGFTPIIAVIVAYLGKREPEDWRTSHYEFGIWTFWLALAGSGLAWALIIIGIPLSFVIVGIPLLIIGGLMLAVLGVWFAVRAALGLMYALKGEAYPRPRSLLA